MQVALKIRALQDKPADRLLSGLQLRAQVAAQKTTGSTTIDKGRFDVTQNPADMHVFKVPSLRNVAMTPPYFHDGSIATLPAAVRIMARVQLGRTLTDGEVVDIVAFLESLTGQLPADFVTAPLLPSAGTRP